MPDQLRGPPWDDVPITGSGETIMPCQILAVVGRDEGFAQWEGYPQIPKKGDWVTLRECVGRPGSRPLECHSFRVAGGTWGASHLQEYDPDPEYYLVIDLETGELP